MSPRRQCPSKPRPRAGSFPNALAAEQVLHHRFQISGLDVDLAPGSAVSAEIIRHQGTRSDRLPLGTIDGVQFDLRIKNSTLQNRDSSRRGANRSTRVNRPP